MSSIVDSIHLWIRIAAAYRLQIFIIIFTLDDIVRISHIPDGR